MKQWLILLLAVSMTGCAPLNDLTKYLGITTTRTCEAPKDGYMRCTTTTVEDGVACVGSCAVHNP